MEYIDNALHVHKQAIRADIEGLVVALEDVTHRVNELEAAHGEIQSKLESAEYQRKQSAENVSKALQEVNFKIDGIQLWASTHDEKEMEKYNTISLAINELKKAIEKSTKSIDVLEQARIIEGRVQEELDKIQAPSRKTKETIKLAIISVLTVTFLGWAISGTVLIYDLSKIIGENKKYEKLEK